MRGQDAQQATMFSDVSPEERVPSDPPLRPLRTMVEQALLALSPRFAQLYSPIGRPGCSPTSTSPWTAG